MKHNYQNIIKKTYAKPVIEEVMIDVAISIAMVTEPPTEPGGPGEWGDGDVTGDAQGVSSYEPATLKSISSPFPDVPKY